MNPPPVVMFPTRKPLPPSRKKRSRVQGGGQLVTPPGQVWRCKVPDVGLGLADKNRSVRLLVFGDRWSLPCLSCHCSVFAGALVRVAAALGFVRVRSSDFCVACRV